MKISTVKISVLLLIIIIILSFQINIFSTQGLEQALSLEQTLTNDQNSVKTRSRDVKSCSGDINIRSENSKVSSDVKACSKNSKVRVGPEYLFEVKTKDQLLYLGKIISQDEKLLVLETENKTVEIPVNNIKRIRKIKIIGKKHYYEDPIPYKLLLSPTGKTLKKGEGYFSDIFIVYPMYYYGLSDKVTIGGGAFIPNPALFFSLSIKVSLTSNDKHKLAAGICLLNFFNSYKLYTLGSYYLASTHGDTFNNFTIGLGVMTTGEENGGWTLMLGGEKRIFKNLAFVTDNWISYDSEEEQNLGFYSILSTGLRLIFPSWCLTFAVFVEPSPGAGIVPYISFSFQT